MILGDFANPPIYLRKKEYTIHLPKTHFHFGSADIRIPFTPTNSPLIKYSHCLCTAFVILHPSLQKCEANIDESRPTALCFHRFTSNSCICFFARSILTKSNGKRRLPFCVATNVKLHTSREIQAHYENAPQLAPKNRGRCQHLSSQQLSRNIA